MSRNGSYIGAAFSCALLIGISAAHLHAQASPGPITPAHTDDTSAPPALHTRAQTRPLQPAANRSAPRENIGGEWKFNRDQSDDARRKIEQAAQSRDRDNGPYGNGPSGGNGPYGGPFPGAGGPFPGTGGPYGGRNPGLGGDRAVEQAMSPAMSEYTRPALDLTFALKEGEADLTDGDGRKRIFASDGRKIQKTKDENYREIAAHWEGTRLVAEEKDPHGGRIRRSFELSADGRQMDEYVSMEVDRAPVMIHYVYDIVPDRPQ